MPNLSALTNLRLPLGGRRGADVVGLDIQPGYVAAVQAHVNGGIVVERAAGAPLPPDTVREGEVFDERGLGEALQELFRTPGSASACGSASPTSALSCAPWSCHPSPTARSSLPRCASRPRTRCRCRSRTAVLDFHSLGVFETPAGPRQRVIVVAAQREMVERLLRAVRFAGLRAEGVDLSAFALIRSLYRPPPRRRRGRRGGREKFERVLYLNVGGLTNMAIAEGTLCRFTRVVGGGLEAMASEIAERGGIPLVEARALLAAFELNASAPTVLPEPAPSAPEPPAATVEAPETDRSEIGQPAGTSSDFDEGFGPPEAEAEAERVETWELAQGAGAASPAQEPIDRQKVAQKRSAPVHKSDEDVRLVLENGIREIVGEVRNSLDFHRSQEGGGEVQSVVLSGPALELRGFSEALEADLGLAVRRESVRFAGGQDPNPAHTISPHRLAIATGLATEEAPR